MTGLTQPAPVDRDVNADDVIDAALAAYIAQQANLATQARQIADGTKPVAGPTGQAHVDQWEAEAAAHDQAAFDARKVLTARQGARSASATQNA